MNRSILLTPLTGALIAFASAPVFAGALDMSLIPAEVRCVIGTDKANFLVLSVSKIPQHELTPGRNALLLWAHKTGSGGVSRDEELTLSRRHFVSPGKPGFVIRYWTELSDFSLTIDTNAVAAQSEAAAFPQAPNPLVETKNYRATLRFPSRGVTGTLPALCTFDEPTSIAP